MKMHLPSAVAALVLAGSTGVMAQSGGGTPTPDFWALKTQSENFGGGAGATDGTYFYLFGGQQQSPSGGQEDFKRLRRYDPVSDSWVTLAAMPNPIILNAGAFHGGKLFSFGGRTLFLSNNVSISSIHAYTVSTDTWTTLTSTLTSTRDGCSAAVLGSKIYVAGGADNDTISDRLDEFDPATNTITPRAGMPSGRIGSCMAAVDGLNKLYVLGGAGIGTGFSEPGSATCFEYSPPDNDPATSNDDTWTSRAAININGTPVPRVNAAAFTLAGRVYLTGGFGPIDPLNTNLEYNPATDTWSERAALIVGQTGHAACSINGKGYVYGEGRGEEYTLAGFSSLTFTGFLSPIGGADATGGSFSSPVETFKLNSTIPVKFSLARAGEAVTTGVHTIAVTKYSDETTSDSPIDATPQGAATSGNQFNLTGNEWHFNLDTKGTGMSKGIWLLTATLSDRSKHTAWIQIK